jgi:hypothetical protein
LRCGTTSSLVAALARNPYKATIPQLFVKLSKSDSLTAVGFSVMPSPFPGMNPYLEHPSLWTGINHTTTQENTNYELRITNY